MTLKSKHECYSIAPSRRGTLAQPLVMGHRGAAFSIPEHTLEAYQLAFELGANYVEPDFVPTKDGRLIAHHDIDLSTTTNIASLFPNRSRTLTLNGVATTAYFSFDFTLDEVRQLKVRQRFQGGIRSERYDWLFGVPTLEDIAHLLHQWKEQAKIEYKEPYHVGRGGMWAELKKPRWILEQTGIRIEDLFLEEILNLPDNLRKMFFPLSYCPPVSSNPIQALFNRRVTPIPPPLAVHCFEREPLKYLHQKFKSLRQMGLLGSSNTSVLPPTVLLLSQHRCHSFNSWSIVAKYLDGVNFDMACLWNNLTSSDGTFTGQEGSELVEKAHHKDLAVFSWTERAEKRFLLDPFVDAESEMLALICDVRIDGIFAENVDIATRAANRVCPTPHVLKNSRRGKRVNMSFDSTISYTFRLLDVSIMVLLMACIFVVTKTVRRRVNESKNREELIQLNFQGGEKVEQQIYGSSNLNQKQSLLTS